MLQLLKISQLGSPLHAKKKLSISKTAPLERHVHFGEKPTVIPSHKVILDEDMMHRVFYQDEDLERFENEIQSSARRHILARNTTYANQTVDQRNNSIRGIEHIADPRLRRKQYEEKEKLKQTLLSEQTRQRSAGTYPDLDKFRDVSRRVTKAAKDRARVAAREDERQARENKGLMFRKK